MTPDEDAAWREMVELGQETVPDPAAGHDYLSTACLHDLCGQCRRTCKFCEASCRHPCHAREAAT